MMVGLAVTTRGQDTKAHRFIGDQFMTLRSKSCLQHSITFSFSKASLSTCRDIWCRPNDYSRSAESKWVLFHMKDLMGIFQL